MYVPLNYGARPFEAKARVLLGPKNNAERNIVYLTQHY